MQGGFRSDKGDTVTGFADALLSSLASGTGPNHIDIGSLFSSWCENCYPIWKHFSIASHSGDKPRSASHPEAQFTDFQLGQKRNVMHKHAELTKFSGHHRDIHHLAHDRFFRRYDFKEYFIRHLLTILY